MSYLYKHILISIGGIIFPRDFIQFDLSDFDIIFRVTWLCTYVAKIDCKDRKVALNDEKGPKVYFYKQMEEKPCSLIFVTKASKLLYQRFIGYWRYAMDIQGNEDRKYPSST